MTKTTSRLALSTAFVLCSGGLAPAAADAQAVAVYTDRPAVPVPIEQVRSLDRTGLRHLWAWAADAPPRKLAADQLGELQLERGGAVAEVEVVGRGSGPAADRSADPTEALVAIAAPVSMWGEVPEPLLPRWPLLEGRAQVPVADEPWRLRVIGRALGSWWVDPDPQARRVQVQLGAATTLSARVRDGEGEPLPAFVSLLEGDGRGGERLLAQGRADERGTVELDAVPDGKVLTLVVGAPGFAPSVVSGETGRLPGIIALSRGSTVAAVVADDRGAPVQGAAVRAELYPQAGSNALVARETETDAQGRVALAGLPPGRAVVAVRADGFSPLSREVEVAADSVDLGKLVLSRSVAVPIAVHSDEGGPVPAAQVRLPLLPPVETDRRGMARLAGLHPTASSAVTVEAEGFLPRELSLSPPLPEVVTVILQRAFTVDGRFLDPAGAPVGEARVRVARGERYEIRDTDGDGRFRLALTPESPYELTFSVPSGERLQLALAPGLPGEVRDLGDLRAERGLTLVGRVLRGDDGAPAAGARIWLPRPQADGALVAWVHGDLVQAVSDGQGFFRLSGLPPVPLLLRIDAAGLAREHLEVVPEAGLLELDVGDLWLDGGGTVVVTLDEDGEAVGQLDLRNEWLEIDMLTRPSSAGEIVFENIPEGRSTVSVARGGHLLCEEEVAVESGRTTEVPCAAPETLVQGRVWVDEQPAPGGTLVWKSDHDPPGGALILHSRSPLGLRRSSVYGAGRPAVEVLVDDDGWFETRWLRPGLWKVTLSGPRGRFLHRGMVEVPEVDEHSVDLRFGGSTVSGWVVDDDEAAVAEAVVRELDSGATALSDAAGAFALQGLEPGTRRLQARRKGLSSAIVSTDVVAGEPTSAVRLVLSDEGSGRLTIVVEDPLGGAAGGAFCFVEADGRPLQILTTGSVGTAEATFAAPYPSRVRVAAYHRGMWSLGAWSAYDDAEGSLVVGFPDAGSVQVLSEDTSAGPLGLVSTAGWDLGRLSVLLGLRPALPAGGVLQIDGLPPGAYQLAIGSLTRPIVVEAGERAEVELP
ncbi:MAG TPA: carboxypeptidase-like regulatory domain-containing protein [Thermoanaerobaculia bacterium]|nr:carboxypeptidase-like regulatory domain-containing protein [Thermoanaerobaculia bacterium]